MFLIPDAMTRPLIDCAAANHLSWFQATAAASGGDVNQTQGLIWTVAGTEATIAFPHLEEDDAGAFLDAVIAECRERELERVGCWSLSPTQPDDLGVRLAARGFEWGWRPHWMALDLSAPLTAPDLPNPIVIALDDDCDWEVEDLPYYHRADAPSLHALTQAAPRRTWHFVARQDGAVVGHSTLHVTPGEYSVGGLYNVGVVPAARHLGIGSAVSLAACRFAKDLGCSYALLNSAADGLYTRLGFQSMGYGQTWWMHTPALQAPAPTPAQVVFAEAIGHGDVATLNIVPLSGLPDDLSAALPNGMTPMALAVRAESSASAEWLIARGVILDLLDAWDLDGELRAHQMLVNAPELVNRRAGDWQMTPLHEAVQRNDIALVRFLLAADADVTLQDSAFHSTPLGWANHLQRHEIATLLENYQPRSGA